MMAGIVTPGFSKSLIMVLTVHQKAVFSRKIESPILALTAFENKKGQRLA